MNRMSEADLALLLAGKDRSPGKGKAAKQRKYRNKPVQVNGRTFDSGIEVERYRQLLWLEEAGEITDLRCQHHFPLVFEGKFGTFKRKYIADFTYRDRAGAFVVEDVKSPVTRTKPEYRIKREMMAVIHGIEIKEVMAKRGGTYGR